MFPQRNKASKVAIQSYKYGRARNPESSGFRTLCKFDFETYNSVGFQVILTNEVSKTKLRFFLYGKV